MPAPWEWWVSRLCEEFHCLPSEAMKEWQRAPVGLLETIIEMRAYVATKRIYDNAKSKEDLPQSPMMDLVVEIDFEMAAGE